MFIDFLFILHITQFEFVRSPVLLHSVHNVF